MNFINKKNRAVVAVKLFEQILEPLLKIAAVFGACYHRGHIQRQHPLAAQRLGDLPGGNCLGQRFGQRAFADAGLAQKAGIVFLTAAEDLDHTFQFFFPAKHGVKPPLLRKTGQVAAVFVTGAAAARGVHSGLHRQDHLSGKLAAFPCGLRHLDARSGQPDAGSAGGVLKHGTEQVLVFGLGSAGCVCA